MSKPMANATRTIIASLLFAGCGFGPADHGVHVQSFEIEPKTVNVGDEFQVTWRSRHNAGPGDIYWYGVYFADDSELEALGQLFSNDDDVPKLFARGDLAGDPGHVTCTRDTANSVRCSPFGGFAGTLLPGRHTLTLRACLSYVLGDTDTCDSRGVEVDFP